MARTKSKSEKIRKLLEEGKSVKEITKIAKASPQLVYGIRAKMKKASGITAIPKKPEAQPIIRSGITTITATEPLNLTASVNKPKPTLWQRIIKWLKGE